MQQPNMLSPSKNEWIRKIFSFWRQCNSNLILEVNGYNALIEDKDGEERNKSKKIKKGIVK